MKNIIKLLCCLLLVSCETEPLYIPCNTQYPTNQNPTSYVDVNFLDGCWNLLGGELYMENLETGESTELLHFQYSDTSSLRYNGSMYEFEDIIKKNTSWCFDFPVNVPGMGSFVLNSDSLYPYGLSVTSNNITITEPLVGSYLLLGGSSRPLVYEIISLENKIVNFYVQETYENIDGYNCRYYSKLKFKKY